MNQDILKERYTEYRIKMKSPKFKSEKVSIKKEMSEFLKAVAECFGQDVANQLVKPKRSYGKSTDRRRLH